MLSLTDNPGPRAEPGLRGRIALVTGSTGGIGLAVARALARAGCDIRLHGLASAAEAAPALAELEALGIRASYHRAELADPTAIAALIAEAGPPDILVNNAAARHFGPVEETTPEAWDEDIAVNLSAAFHLVRLSLPVMRRRGWGRVLNMSSIYGLIGAANRVGYVTTKTALIGLTRAVALETATSGITCNALCPGSTLTPNIEARLRAAMAAGGLDRGAAEAQFLAGKQPTGRFVQAEAIGAMAAFLCSEAGRDITGAVLPLDGGWSAA
ncbi:SDR family oxidoreductase [Siccirubricoccus sp. KC 17139]|uniref:SDR family oxidoreductase n=1 Tax=Siccirubricoccus soli TaxID=2899147 RepID=A0ABT1CZK1_9PROT|nr:SDR family NAD(P)-dependent oxidoreductase [Siccirubricoccus soli]MCO6415077.1 SDR family oxidoreductase [Siccirubricoccus soli]MCP2681208.1 SDR family oxidoreductase [Siccirubricoccus soli]